MNSHDRALKFMQLTACTYNAILTCWMYDGVNRKYESHII